MQNYLIDNVAELTDVSDNATALVVHKLHRTPYHLGILHEGFYYSLTVDGVQIIEQINCIEDLKNKVHNNLLILLKKSGTTTDCRIFFEKQSLNSKDFVSCLFPIRSFLAQLYANNKLNAVNNLFELLDVLKESNLIVQTFATRLTPIMENKIVLMRYDEELIKKHIKKLLELR